MERIVSGFTEEHEGRKQDCKAGDTAADDRDFLLIAVDVFNLQRFFNKA